MHSSTYMNMLTKIQYIYAQAGQVMHVYINGHTSFKSTLVEWIESDLVF